MSFFEKMPIEKDITKYSEVDRWNRRGVRIAYIHRQKGECWHCRGELASPPPDHILEKKITPRLYPANFFDGPNHIHHNHDTDDIIGVVHPHCNAILWEYFNE